MTVLLAAAILALASAVALDIAGAPSVQARAVAWAGLVLMVLWVPFPGWPRRP